MSSDVEEKRYKGRVTYWYSCLREDLMTKDQLLDFWTKDVIQRVLENENKEECFYVVRDVIERMYKMEKRYG